MKNRLPGLLIACTAVLAPWAAAQAQGAALSETVFRDVRVFDGKSARLSGPLEDLYAERLLLALSSMAAAQLAASPRR